MWLRRGRLMEPHCAWPCRTEVLAATGGRCGPLFFGVFSASCDLQISGVRTAPPSGFCTWHSHCWCGARSAGTLAGFSGLASVLCAGMQWAAPMGTLNAAMLRAPVARASCTRQLHAPVARASCTRQLYAPVVDAPCRTIARVPWFPAPSRPHPHAGSGCPEWATHPTLRRSRTQCWYEWHQTRR